MRVNNLARAAQLLEGTTLMVDEELCLNLRARGVSCRRCSERCRAEALSLSADAIELDELACTQCGACVPACPTGVMRLSGFAPVRFLEGLAGQREVHLHCRASTDTGGGVVIPCHQVLDARLLAAALADGTERFILHGPAGCGSCPKGDASAHVHELQERLREWFGDQAPLLEVAQSGETTVIGPRQREGQVQMGRRSFLRLAGAQAVSGTAGWLLPIDEPEKTGETLPFYQADAAVTRPVACQSLLAERVKRLPWAEARALPWRSRTLADQCSACLVCGERCPTGALQASEDERTRAITFEAALCTDCGLCEQLCPQQAVRPQPSLSVDQVGAPRMLLMHRAMMRCRGCGHPFVAGAERPQLCDICRNEQEIDDEWLAMLEG